jgi:hypothetical protein
MQSDRRLPTFRRNVIPPGSKCKPSKQGESKSDFGVVVFFSLSLLFDPEEGGSMFFRNVGELLPDYTASEPLPWYLQISNGAVPSLSRRYHIYSSEIQLESLMRPPHVYVLRKWNISHTEEEMSLVLPVLLLLFVLLHLHVRYLAADFSAASRMYVKNSLFTYRTQWHVITVYHPL